MIAKDAAEGGRRQQTPALGEQDGRAATALRAQVRRDTGIVRVRGREIEPSTVRGPPSTLDREAGDVRGRTLPVAPERESVRDVSDRFDPARRPATVGRLEDPRLGRIRDEERVVVRPVEVEVARPTLPVRLAQRGDDVERFGRAPRPLEPEPDEDPCRGVPSVPSGSRVKTVSFPIATRCSLTPCSSPQSQCGCVPMIAAVSATCGSSRYWQRTRAPGSWRRRDSCTTR
jgi:hypothetical protein